MAMEDNKKVTIYDIAKEAGVSPARGGHDPEAVEAGSC